MSITGLVFLVAFCGGLALALFRDPIYGLYTYVAEFYLSPPSRWWGESLPDLRWSFLAAGVTVLALLFHLRSGQRSGSLLASPAAKIMLAFVVWWWIESLWALDPAIHHQFAIQVTKYLVVFFLILRLVNTPSRITAFLLLHIAGCLYIGVLAYQIGTDGLSKGRLDGVGGPGVGDSNTLGMQMATAVVIAAMLAIHLRGWRRALCLIAIAFCLNAIVLAASRGAFVSLLAGGIALTFLKPSRYRAQFYGFALLGVLAIGYVGSEQFWNRMATTEAVVTGDTYDMDTSAYSRIAIIKAQMKMAVMYPFGAGHRGTVVLNYKLLDQKFMSHEGGRSSHNVFMTLLVEEGLPGAIMFFLMVGWAALTLKRIARLPTTTPEELTRTVQSAAIGGALAVILVAGIFADFSQAEVQTWMLAALAAVARPAASTVRSSLVPSMNGGVPSSNSSIETSSNFGNRSA